MTWPTLGSVIAIPQGCLGPGMMRGMTDGLYRNRERAESFGTVAAAYDRFRPGYPDELLDLLTAPAPQNILDVGCGTGKVAVQLARRGFPVLGIEIDPKMARVARGHDIAVEVAPFETWQAHDRSFDLITCGQAWHWIDPSIGPAKAADLLRPGGTLALFWNFEKLPDEARARLDDAYARHAPEVHRVSNGRARSEDLAAASLTENAGFAAIRTRTFRRAARYSTADAIGLLGTHSDHNLLPQVRRDALLDAVAEAIDGLGGFLDVEISTTAVLASK
jgi:SAM-dependent methyltransferase